MKTIMIVIGGLSDRPEIKAGGKTPLMEAEVPSLDNIARFGRSGMICNVPENVAVTPTNALLGLLGYDFSRPVPADILLKALGTGYNYGEQGMPWFIIPKYSGHGVILTDNARARGIGMLSLLRPAFTVRPDDVPGQIPTCGTLSDKAQAAIQAIEMFDFILIYVDGPYRRSLNFDRDGKIEAIEDIDRELITPVADYVWKAKMPMNLIVTGDLVMNSATGRPERGDVPASVYYNDDLPYDTNIFDEESLLEGPLNAPCPGDLIRQVISFEPAPEG